MGSPSGVSVETQVAHRDSGSACRAEYQQVAIAEVQLVLVAEAFVGRRCPLVEPESVERMVLKLFQEQAG